MECAGVSAPVILAAGLFALWSNSAVAQDFDEGKSIYDVRCASCHGEKLEGQPNWMERLPDGRLPAPPHDATGHTWHHSDGQLLRIIRDGLASIAPGYETDMPAFGQVLDDRQIMAVLDYIKSTWPERERSLQKLRSGK
ncbi:MAG: cytochrome c [Alphaproteobacteria bacterium]|nr:cytochrome c [Alphaproteobacteria bacterium]